MDFIDFYRLKNHANHVYPLKKTKPSCMKICVLQPDYGASEVDYKNYDPPRRLDHLRPEAQVDLVFLNKLTTYRQLKKLKHERYDIFVNLCEAYLEWDIPSIDVIHSLELLNLPHTGPSSQLYDPPKALMKYVAHAAGVATPDFTVAEQLEDLEKYGSHLAFPLFVKPAKAGDSLGVNDYSLVHTHKELREKVTEIIEEYESALVEEYVAGREFTVLVAASAEPSQPPLAYLPLEFVFPEGQNFKTYALKITQWHPECNEPCRDEALAERLRDAARRIFKAFGGLGYARLDFRMNDAGQIFFLEINFACSVFYPEGSEGSADYILKHDGAGQAVFLRQIIAEGIARHRNKQRKYVVRGSAVAGFGICAARDIRASEIVWRGEEQAQRIASRAWVERHWTEEEKEIFRQYAYPISEEVFILWSENPDEWAPQNHSCAPNTGYKGLNLIALRDIAVGEELTLDYATILDENAAPFECQCGATGCRGLIRGVPGNNVTQREKLAASLAAQ